MKKKIAHFYREPLKIKQIYSEEQLDVSFDKEDDFQREAIRFIYSCVKDCDLVEVIHIPGGSARVSIANASKLKLNGARAGVFDLMLLWCGGVAFIECKATKGYPTPAQKEFAEYLTNANHRGYLCKTLRQIQSALFDLGLLHQI